MKNLVLNQMNLHIREEGREGFCDFCGEESKKGILGSQVHKYKTLDFQKKEYDAQFTPLICMDCIKQLAILIKQ